MSARGRIVRWSVLAGLGGALAALVAVCLPLPPARAAASGGPISEKVILDETSIDGPALWSIANGTVRTGAATYVSALAWTGTDSAHSLNLRVSPDGLHYDNKITLNETSPYRPAVLAVSPAGPFLLAWTGTDPQHSLNLLYDVYGSRRKLTLGETATGAPALAALDGKVYLAWTGTNPGRSLNILPITLGSSGQLSAGAKTILSQYSSDEGPSLVADTHNNGQLVLSWTYPASAASSPSAINEAYSTDGAHWTTPLVAPPPQTSVAAPAILASSTSSVVPYYWAWSGTDALHSLNIIGSSSLQSWPGPVNTLNEQSTDSPALGYIGSGSSALLAWTGTDPLHHLNVATFSLGGPSSAASTCQATQLGLFKDGSNGAAGHIGQQYHFTNTSTQSCTLDGYPNAQLLDANRAPMTTHVTQSTHGYLYTGENPQTVTLTPGGSAHFVVEWSDVPTAGSSCARASYVKVTPPGASTALTIPTDIDTCGGNLTISPVEPTAFGF